MERLIKLSYRIGADLVFEKFWSSFLKRNDSSPWTKIMADFEESVSYIKNSSSVLTLIWHSPTSTSIKVLKRAIPNDRIHSLCRHLTRTDLDSLRVLNVYLLKHIEAQHPLRNQCDTTHLRLTIVSCASEHLSIGTCRNSGESIGNDAQIMTRDIHCVSTLLELILIA